MRIEQLSSFVEIAKCNSIHMAATNLNISSQALNKSLQNLEQELNVQLFHRSKRGVRLTEKGQVVFDAALDILARIDARKEDLRGEESQQKKKKKKLNLWISPMLSISVFPPAYAEFSSLYPNVSVFTCESYRENIIERVQKEPATVGLLLVSKQIADFFDNIPDDIELIELKDYPIMMVVSPRHALAGQKSISIRTLQDYPLIIFEVGGSTGVHALSKLGDFKIGLSSNNVTICENLLNKNQAVMYGFKPYVKRGVFPDFEHIPLADSSLTFTAYVAVNKNMPVENRKAAGAFINVFKHYL